jgi:hypothetical protein
MLVVWNGFPPTNSGWKLKTRRSLSLLIYLPAICQTVRHTPSVIICGAIFSMDERLSNGTSPSWVKPTSKIFFV